MNLIEREKENLFFEYGFAEQKQPAFDHLLLAFEHKVEKYPNQIAVRYNGESITYASLDIKAEALAFKMQRNGVKAQDRVGVFLHRSIEMIIAKVACFKLGAAYVPQHANVAPVKQMAYVVEVSNIDIVLTLNEYQDKLSKLNCNTLAVAHNALTESNEKLVKYQCNTNDTAFILFTSGTTGNPNGVAVSHKNLCNILLTAPGNLNINKGTKVSQILSISFDMAAWEIWGCLCNGGELLIRGKNIDETCQKANVIIATPSILASIDETKIKKLRTAIVAGEPCPKDLAKRWHQFCDFYNSCGPTETTIVNTIGLFRPEKPLSIGVPTPNNNVYILDDNMQPVAIGKVGMMWAGGDCVTQGYINNQPLSQIRYKNDPFVKNGKMFRTGDLGRWNEFGELEHYGRADDQIKIKGFRVELDSVSKKIEAIEGIERAAVIKLDNKTLLAFYTGKVLNDEKINRILKLELPYYAIPSQTIFLDKLPQTDRGKIDKRSLLKRFQQQVENSVVLL